MSSSTSALSSTTVSSQVSPAIQPNRKPILLSDGFPDNAAQKIFSYLSLSDLQPVAGVCRNLNALSIDLRWKLRTQEKFENASLVHDRFGTSWKKTYEACKAYEKIIADFQSRVTSTAPRSLDRRIQSAVALPLAELAVFSVKVNYTSHSIKDSMVSQ